MSRHQTRTSNAAWIGKLSRCRAKHRKLCRAMDRIKQLKKSSKEKDFILEMRFLAIKAEFAANWFDWLAFKLGVSG